MAEKTGKPNPDEQMNEEQEQTQDLQRGIHLFYELHLPIIQAMSGTNYPELVLAGLATATLSYMHRHFFGDNIKVSMASVRDQGVQLCFEASESIENNSRVSLISEKH